MSPRSKALSEIQRLLKAVPDEMEIISTMHQLEDAYYKGQDINASRAATMLAVGFLEHALNVAIGTYLINDESIRKKLFEGDRERDGIAGTLYSKIVLARALDIYGERTYKDLITVKQIRNLCAHAKSEIDFSDEKLTPLQGFYTLDAINGALGYGAGGRTLPDRLTTQSPLHGVLQFLQYLLPYLILHNSQDYLTSQNRADWRKTFS